MKLTATREDLLAPLQSVIGVVERRQTMPVLANVLLAARDDKLNVTGTDLEVELVATSTASVQQPGDITVPGRKLLDIFRSLPEKTSVTMSTDGERVTVRAGRSRFTLSSLPAAEFPVVEEINAQQTLTLAQGEFRRLIDKTHFSMAQQDVRYYLNGLLLETDGKALRAVATDGHRLALCEMELAGKAGSTHQVIVPRKGVLELQRILGTEGEIELAVGTNHVRAKIGDIRFTSKLIDGRFPEYARVIPSSPPAGSKPTARRCARRCNARRSFPTKNTGGFASPPGRICSCCRRITPSRKKPKIRSRSPTRVRKSRSASTSITCSTPSAPSRATGSRSASLIPTAAA